MPRSQLISVSDPTHVGQARRVAASLAANAGFSETEAGKVSIVVTELTKNLIKHAHRGQILLRSLECDEQQGLEILSIDKGPGMVDPSRCMEDGYSTAGSPGTGLGAIQRLSQVFDIYSQPGKGTVLVAQLGAKPERCVKPALETGAVCVPWHEGDACGDAWQTQEEGNHRKILVVDGLGHGPLAAQAADEALKAFAQLKGLAPPAMVEGMHGPLRATRGASLALADLDLRGNTVRYCGVGNISATILDGAQIRRMVSHNGTLGHEFTKAQEFTYAWQPSGTLIMHSDGLLSRWNLDPYPGLLARHPSIIAGVLFRDFLRGRDDATVLVARRSNHAS